MKKKPINFNSVFSRFSFAVLTIIIIAFSLLVLITTMAVNYYYSRYEDELAYYTLTAKVEIEERYRQFQGSDSDELFWQAEGGVIARTLFELTDSSAAAIIVADGNGQLCYVDPSLSNFASSTVEERYLPSDAEDRMSCQLGRIGLFSEEQYYSSINVYVKGERIATVFVCLPSSNVKQPITAIHILIVVISVGVMSVTFLASYLVSRRITNPLVKMSTAAKAFADGDFSVRVPIVGRDEVAEFAKVFNEMAESLDQFEKMRNDFIANVSHDLRSPMTSIQGFVDGMLSGVIPPEKHEHYLGVVSEETKRLSRLVTTLLEISRIQAGEKKYAMSCFDICELARRILFSCEKRIEDKQLDVRFEFEYDRAYVVADRDAIHQVLYNLVDNAVKFSHEGGKLVVSAQEKNEKILISIYNEGEGLTPEEMKLIFERFYKVDRSRGIDKSGTGLGLYIAKKIIEAHRETLTVDSQYQAYCRFSFTLQKSDKPVDSRL